MKDSIYNRYLFSLLHNNTPIFLEKYFNVPSLNRLKSIGYFCGMDYASKEIYDFKEKISRYDHSIDVALLTWKFTNNKKATVAGLFHDIATPCFSHVIDYMNKDYEKQESTEEYTAEIIKNDTRLLECLKEDRISCEDIINFKKYTIVDNDRPKMCADRFDGIILTGIAWTKTLNKEDIDQLVENLDVYKNEYKEKELGFKTEKVALKALETSNIINEYCHSNFDNFMMELLAQIVRVAIEKSVITYKELYFIDEDTLLDRIAKSRIKKLANLLNKFKNIKLDEIPVTEIKNIKSRQLTPLVNGVRLNNNSALKL